MSYRMKRNGASLASICILSTGVLVMISSSLCLRIGEDESLHARYPRDIEVSILTKDYDQSIAAASYIEQQVDAVLQASHQTRKNELAYNNLNFAALRQGGDISVKQYTEVSGTQYAESIDKLPGHPQGRRQHTCHQSCHFVFPHSSFLHFYFPRAGRIPDGGNGAGKYRDPRPAAHMVQGQART